jgi:hypothetical protein
MRFRKKNIGCWLLLMAMHWGYGVSAQLPRAFAADYTEVPTEKDHRLAVRLSALLKEWDYAQSPARELIFEGSRTEIASYQEALASMTAVNRYTLGYARRYAHRVVPQLEALKLLSPPPVYQVAKRQGALVIDGRLDEAAWCRAKLLTMRFERLKVSQDEPATVRLLWDDKFLYAAFEVPDTDIISPFFERDEPVWQNDCVELFVVPDRQSGAYWEIEISPTGALYDALCTKYLDRWGSDMKIEKSLTGLQIGRALHGTPNQSDDRDEGYTVEVAIPFGQLPGLTRAPRRGDELYGLFGHVNRDGAGPTTSLAQVPYASWFHNIWMYQPIVLKR